MLKIALPNGSLQSQTVELFHKAGINLEVSGRRYEAKTDDRRIARAVFMRPHIIPYVVGRGCYDLGVTGSDMIAEAAVPSATVLTKLSYKREPGHEWRLVLLGGQEDPAMNLQEIKDDACILSEYPRITQEALDHVGKKTTIQFSHGSTEANVPDDFPYGVCIVSSETTLKANGLKIIQVLSVETAVIIGGPTWLENRRKESASNSLMVDLQR